MISSLCSGISLAQGDEGLTREQAQQTIERESRKIAKTLQQQGKIHEVSLGAFRMPWLEKTFGDAPEGKKSLWISMHGGGATSKETNDQQWQNQIRLYQLQEGVYVAPRAPIDAWDMWHRDYMEPLLDQLISYMVATHGVDPNRVYLLGYSAGGDGAWQLGPRMADRWAAVAMMAGHPGFLALENLRHTPSAMFCGGDDAAYQRNAENAKCIEKMKFLAKEFPGDYQNFSKIYPNTGHWMNGNDAEGLPWMSQFTRNPWPKTLSWRQSDKLRDSFFWVGAPQTLMKAGDLIQANVEGQTIRLTGNVPNSLHLKLADQLVNLDQSITLMVNGVQRFQGKLRRDEGTITRFLTTRLDPAACPTAEVMVAWNDPRPAISIKAEKPSK